MFHVCLKLSQMNLPCNPGSSSYVQFCSALVQARKQTTSLPDNTYTLTKCTFIFLAVK